MRYNSQCILVFSSTTIIPKKRAHARFCVIETVFLNYLFVTAPLLFRKNFYLLEELLYKILNNDTCNFIIMNNIATMIFSI